MTVRKTVDLVDPPEGEEWYQSSVYVDGEQVPCFRHRPIKPPTIMVEILREDAVALAEYWPDVDKDLPLYRMRSAIRAALADNICRKPVLQDSQCILERGHEGRCKDGAGGWR